MNSTSNTRYKARIVPALQEIQEADGYLRRDKMELAAKRLGEPLYKLQAVASFFPHFRVTAPPKVSVHICRDTACFMAGSNKMIAELKKSYEGNKEVHIDGTSCLGRCDRCPSASIGIHRHAPESHKANGNGNALDKDLSHAGGGEEELYFHGKTLDEIKKTIDQCLSQPKPPAQDLDTGPKGGPWPYPSADWKIDSYGAKAGGSVTYEGVKKALELRNKSLDAAVVKLKGMGWSVEKAEQFRIAAEAKLLVSFKLDKDVVDKVREWQTATGFAEGKEIGDWADVILDEFDAAKADLRGLGGAGIPATQKWRDVREAVRKRVFARWTIARSSS